MEAPRGPQRERIGRSIVSKMMQLKKLELGELYEIFQDMRIVHGDDVVKEFKSIISKLYSEEYGDVLTLDDKALVADTPEKLVNEIASRIFDVLEKHYREAGVATTAGSVKYESVKRSQDLLTRALRLLIILQGWA